MLTPPLKKSRALPDIRLTRYFHTQIYFTEVMPKTATGKIQRRIVAETMQKQEVKAKL